MSDKPHILVILGSTRHGRAGEKVFEWLRGRIAGRTDMSYEFIDLRDMPLPFLYQEVLPAQGEVAPEAATWAKLVDRADGFIFVTPEYNNGYPAVLKNAIDYLYPQWHHKPGAVVSYGGWASGYRCAQQLRHVMIELKMVPVRDQVGITFVPGAAPALEADTDSSSMKMLEANLEKMLAELLWWTVALGPARRSSFSA